MLNHPLYLLRSERRLTLFPGVDLWHVDKIMVPFRRVQFVAIIVNRTGLHHLYDLDDISDRLWRELQRRDKISYRLVRDIGQERILKFRKDVDLQVRFPAFKCGRLDWLPLPKFAAAEPYFRLLFESVNALRQNAGRFCGIEALQEFLCIALDRFLGSVSEIVVSKFCGGGIEIQGNTDSIWSMRSIRSLINHLPVRLAVCAVPDLGKSFRFSLARWAVVVRVKTRPQGSVSAFILAR